MKKHKVFLLLLVCFSFYSISCSKATEATEGEKSDTAMSGNPVFKGWYADPEARIFNNEYWIYPTYSAPYGQQVFFDAFSSPDLVNWTKHSNIMDTSNIKWAKRAVWAPTTIFKNGKYYIFFAANDIQNDNQFGGIGVGISDNPAGPFRDALGKPLISKFQNGAQPIDPHVYMDDDGKTYLYYGGWGHCNVTQLSDDLLSLVPFPDGSIYKEITPQGYVEGPCMIKRNGKYYFMWAEGGWTGPDYSVAYAIARSPLGPFTRVGKILQQDPAVATGAGHHGIINPPGTDQWYIVYHRHPLGDTNGNHRETCIDNMYFNSDGTIKPVKITFEGVKDQKLK